MVGSRSKFKEISTILCVGMFIGSAATAESSKPRIGGFLNQTLIHTSDNNFFGESDDSLSSDYWEAGLLLRANLTSKLELSSVALARSAGKVDDGHPRIDQFLFTYRLVDGFDQSQGIRAGRTKQRFGIYNQTRDVPFTRPGILLPQSTYLDRERNTLLIIDDLSYYYEIRSEEYGTWHFDVAKFKTHPLESEFEDFINYNVSVDLEGRYGWGYQIIWRSPMDVWLLGISAGESGNQFTANNHNLFNADKSFNLINTDGHFDIQAADVFLQFNQAEWQVTAEVTLTDSGFYNLNSITDEVQASSLSYYIQTDYHFNPRHGVFVRYDVHELDKHDPDGEKFAQSDFGRISGTPGFARYSIDTTLGYSWLPRNDWMVRLELHNVEGASWVSHLENPDVRSLQKYWNMMMAQLSYRF